MPEGEARRVNRIHVLGNIRHRSDPAGPMAGEEVDTLIAEFPLRGAEQSWEQIQRWLQIRAFGMCHRKEDVGDVVAQTLERLMEVLFARRLLADTHPQPDVDEVAWRVHFNHWAPFRPWLLKTMRNKVRDLGRRTARQRVVAGLDADLAAPGMSMADRAELGLVRSRVPELLALVAHQLTKRETRAEHIRHTFARLPTDHRTVIDMRFPELGIGSLPIAGNDVTMAVHLGTTEKNVSNTRRMYRKFLGEKHPHLVPAFDLMLELSLR